METSRAVKVAVTVGVLLAGAWIWRTDRLCRQEIRHRFGDVKTIKHAFAADLYQFVPPSWKAIWHPGMAYPMAVTCWAGLDGVSEFERR